MAIFVTIFRLIPHQDTKAIPKNESVIEVSRTTAVIVPLGKLARLKNRTGKMIAKAVLSDDKVVKVSDFTVNAVLLEGLAPGITRLTLTDSDKEEEKLIVIVEKANSEK